MYWLRWIIYTAPLCLAFAAVWLFQQISQVQIVHKSDALVYAIARPIGTIHPLAPADGIEGEIAGLVFEPLLRRDGDLHLVPNLIERWTLRSTVTIRCESEEAAGEAEARVLAGEAPQEGPRPLVVHRSGAVLTVVLDGIDEGLEEPLLRALPRELLGDYLLLRVRATHSVEELVSAWLEGSLEKSQVRMMEVVDDREAHLFVGGRGERVLEDLRLYLESNPASAPQLEELGTRCHTTVREMFVEIRPGVFWHDGQAFTAEDVRFAYETLTRPDSPLPLAAAFSYIRSLEVAEPHRLRILCRDSPAHWLESWEALPPLPAHLLGPGADPVRQAAYLSQPVGLGPYRIERRRADGGMEFVAHEAYHLGAPSEIRRRYRRFASLESLLLALRRGAVDLIEPDERFAEWSRRHPGEVEVLRDQPTFQHFVVWNLGRPPLDRGKVREALARAIDLDAVLRDSPTQYQQPTTSLFFPQLPGVTEPMPRPSYDTQAAESLLDGAGYGREEASGWRRDASGRPLGFTLLIDGGKAEHQRLAGALAEQWAAVGVGVEVQALPWEEVLQRLPSRDFDAVMLSWKLPFSRDRRQVWHSSAAGPGGGNLSGLRDGQIDALLDRLAQETDPAALARTTSELQGALAALQPCFFVCDTGRLVTLRAGAVAMRPPGAASPEAIALGKGGLEASRPWWVRKANPQP